MFRFSAFTYSAQRPAADDYVIFEPIASIREADASEFGLPSSLHKVIACGNAVLDIPCLALPYHKRQERIQGRSGAIVPGDHFIAFHKQAYFNYFDYRDDNGKRIGGRTTFPAVITSLVFPSVSVDTAYEFITVSDWNMGLPTQQPITSLDAYVNVIKQASDDPEQLRLCDYTCKRIDRPVTWLRLKHGENIASHISGTAVVLCTGQADPEYEYFYIKTGDDIEEDTIINGLIYRRYTPHKNYYAQPHDSSAYRVWKNVGEWETHLTEVPKPVIGTMDDDDDDDEIMRLFRRLKDEIATHETAVSQGDQELQRIQDELNEQRRQAEERSKLVKTKQQTSRQRISEIRTQQQQSINTEKLEADAAALRTEVAKRDVLIKTAPVLFVDEIAKLEKDIESRTSSIKKTTERYRRLGIVIPEAPLIRGVEMEKEQQLENVRKRKERAPVRREEAPTKKRRSESPTETDVCHREMALLISKRVKGETYKGVKYDPAKFVVVLNMPVNSTVFAVVELTPLVNDYWEYFWHLWGSKKQLHFGWARLENVVNANWDTYQIGCFNRFFLLFTALFDPMYDSQRNAYAAYAAPFNNDPATDLSRHQSQVSKDIATQFMAETPSYQSKPLRLDQVAAIEHSSALIISWINGLKKPDRLSTALVSEIAAKSTAAMTEFDALTNALFGPNPGIQPVVVQLSQQMSQDSEPEIPIKTEPTPERSDDDDEDVETVINNLNKGAGIAPMFVVTPMLVDDDDSSSDEEEPDEHRELIDKTLSKIRLFLSHPNPDRRDFISFMHNSIFYTNEDLLTRWSDEYGDIMEYAEGRGDRSRAREAFATLSTPEAIDTTWDVIANADL